MQSKTAIKSRTLFLQTLGRLSLRRARSDEDSILPPRRLLVPALLATQRGYEADRIYVSQLIWPDSDDPRNALRQAIHQVNKAAGRPIVQTRDDTLRLDTDAVEVDLLKLYQAQRLGFPHAVIDLYRGPFLDGLEDEVGAELRSITDSVNAGIRVDLEAAFNQAIESDLADRRFPNAIANAEQLKALNPLNEAGTGWLIKAHLAAGDHETALRIAKTHEQSVQGDPDADIGPELRKLIAEVKTRATARSVIGSVSPENEAGRADRSARPRSLHIVLAAFAMVAGLYAVQRLGDADPVPGRLFVAVDDDPPWSELTVTDRRVHQRPLPYPAGETVPHPDGVRYAYRVEASDGLNIAIAGGGQPEEIVTDQAGDETPLAWSPDGRWLVYSWGFNTSPGSFRRRPMILDIDTGEKWRLGDEDYRIVRRTDWSPTGTRIAVTVGDTIRSIAIFNPRGALVDRIRAEHGIGWPAWSPSGDRLVFAVSDERGRLGLWDASTREVRYLETLAGAAVSPAWLSPTAIAFTADGPDGGDVWARDLVSGVERRLTTGARATHIVASASWNHRIAALDRVRLSNVPRAIGQGEHVRMVPSLERGDGAGVTLPKNEFTWAFTGPGGFVSLEDDWYRADTLGTGTVRVDVAGWRQDAREFRISMPVVAEVAVRLDEPWASGVDRERWITVGDPRPTWRPDGPRSGTGAVKMNGDGRYRSGLVSRERFDISAGLTVEVDAWIPVLDSIHQGFTVGLSLSEPPRDSTSRTWSEPAAVMIALSGPGQSLGCRCPGDLPPFPIFTPAGAWQTLALQISDAGEYAFVVDGRILWRSRTDLDLSQSAHVMLAGTTVGADILHGPVRVYAGPRYRLASDEP